MRYLALLAMLPVVMLPAAGCGTAVANDDASTQRRMLKDWALARCLTKGAGLNTPAGKDAANSAAARLEFGTYGIEAYEAIEPLVDRQLAKPYAGSTGGTYVTLKCIDLFHSPELDHLVRAQRAGVGSSSK